MRSIQKELSCYSMLRWQVEVTQSVNNLRSKRLILCFGTDARSYDHLLKGWWAFFYYNIHNGSLNNDPSDSTLPWLPSTYYSDNRALMLSVQSRCTHFDFMSAFNPHYAFSNLSYSPIRFSDSEYWVEEGSYCWKLDSITDGLWSPVRWWTKIKNKVPYMLAGFFSCWRGRCRNSSSAKVEH